MSAPSFEDLDDAAQRIEGWLLDSGVRLADGEQRGGVAGWLDGDGRPEFVYLEITGYYLTAMAWLAGGAASSDERAAAVLAGGREALDWMSAATADGALPPTRLYLSPSPSDWRNAAVFTFDLAMAARGAAAFAAAAGTDGANAVVHDLVGRVRDARSDGRLPSHAPREAELPDRWSTRPGPHHIKAAAALLRLPAGVLDDDLARACRESVTNGALALDASWPCRELHPILYGLEGLVMLGDAPGEEWLDVAERVYERLLRLQGEDGSLPAVMGEDHEVRSDVLAQALRLGALLRATGRLPDGDWEGRLDGLAAALLRHVRPDGGVLFSLEQEVANAWCAMFAHQALLVRSRAVDGGGISADAVEHLI